MNLLENNFFILNANIRNSRSELRECFDDAELSANFDEEKIRLAYSELTNINKRILSEISYILQSDISEKSIINMIKNNVINNISDVLSLSSEPLSLTNISINVLSNMEKLDQQQCVEWIVFICKKCEEIKVSNIKNIINESRNEARFNTVDDISLIESAFNEQLKYYKKELHNTLDRFNSNTLVSIITNIIDKLANSGTKPLPNLAKKIVEDYEIAIQSFLIKEKENIANSVKKLTHAIKNNSNVHKEVTDCLLVVKNWDRIVQPIQVARQSQGRGHNDSEKIFEIVFTNDLIQAFIENNQLELCQKYLNELELIFIEVENVDKIIKKHKQDLQEAIKHKNKYAILEEIESSVNLLRFAIQTSGDVWNKKNQVISLINKSARIDNSREMAVPVANLARDKDLTNCCVQNNRLDVLIEINQALRQNFGHHSELLNILNNEINIIHNYQNQISQNKENELEGCISIIIKLVLGALCLFLLSLCS